MRAQQKPFVVEIKKKGPPYTKKAAVAFRIKAEAAAVRNEIKVRA